VGIVTDRQQPDFRVHRLYAESGQNLTLVHLHNVRRMLETAIAGWLPRTRPALTSPGSMRSWVSWKTLTMRSFLLDAEFHCFLADSTQTCFPAFCSTRSGIYSSIS
jgi:hypothetical protein